MFMLRYNGITYLKKLQLFDIKKFKWINSCDVEHLPDTYTRTETYCWWSFPISTKQYIIYNSITMGIQLKIPFQVQVSNQWLGQHIDFPCLNIIN
jgi:hypothetical protein